MEYEAIIIEENRHGIFETSFRLSADSQEEAEFEAAFQAPKEVDPDEIFLEVKSVKRKS